MRVGLSPTLYISQPFCDSSVVLPSNVGAQSCASTSALQPGLYATSVSESFFRLLRVPEVVQSHCGGIPAPVQGN